MRLQASEASNYKNYDLKKGIRPASTALMEEAIGICVKEKNDQLLAGTYFDIAELYNLYNDNEEYLTMLSAAFAIVDRLGSSKFSRDLLYDKLGGMSKAAYHLYGYYCRNSARNYPALHQPKNGWLFLFF